MGNTGGTTVRYPRDVQKFPVINNDDPMKFHPTQKPIGMIEYFKDEWESIIDGVIYINLDDRKISTQHI